MSAPYWQEYLATAPIPLATDEAVVASAVLVIVTAGEAPCLVLTRRSAHLKKHAGQIAFPGGRVDESDETLVETALREAQEEIGLTAEGVQLCGFLPDMLTGTGYRITPVVVQSSYDMKGLEGRLIANPDEVDEIFFVPLSLVLQPDNYDSFQRQDKGLRWRSWRLVYQSQTIWGATAAILHGWACGVS